MKALFELLDQLLALLEAHPHQQVPTTLQPLLEELAQEALALAHTLKIQDEHSKRDPLLSQQRELLTQRALEAIAQARWADAELILEQTLASLPEHEDDYNHLGLVCWERGDITRAERHYARAASLSLDKLPPSPDPWCTAAGNALLRSLEGQALCLYKLGLLDQAQRLFHTLAHTQHPDYQGCHYLCGEILHQQHHLHAALSEYKLAPQEPAVLYNSANIHAQLGQLTQATAALVRAFDANPHIAELLLQRPASAPSPLNGYLGSQGYAQEFVEACAHLWHQAPEALDLLDRCFNDHLVQQQLHNRRARLAQPHDDIPTFWHDDPCHLDSLTQHLLSKK